MRKIVVLLVFLLSVISASSLSAQLIPGIGIDTSWRFEYMFGRQNVQLFTNSDDKQRLNYNFSPRLPLFTGIVEISPIPSLSGRLSGSISTVSAPQTNVKSINEGPFTGPEQTSRYYQWEAAGLYNLWSGEGYRFSIVGGYRFMNWIYTPSRDNVDGNTYATRDEVTNYIPVIGLQSSMFFPLWKARFELLGSPFMNRRLSSYQGRLFSVEAEGQRGGMIEVQFEGSAPVYRNVYLGMNAAYTLVEIYGHGKTNVPGGNTGYKDLYSTDSLFKVGLDVNVVF